MLKQVVSSCSKWFIKLGRNLADIAGQGLRLAKFMEV